MEAKQKTKLDN